MSPFFNKSGMFKSNDDFIFVESPDEPNTFTGMTKKDVVNNMKNYINMSIDLLKNSFNMINDLKSI